MKYVGEDAEEPFWGPTWKDNCPICKEEMWFNTGNDKSCQCGTKGHPACIDKHSWTCRNVKKDKSL